MTSSFRVKALALMALAVGPWPFVLLLGAKLDPWLAICACAAPAMAASWLLARLLRPVESTAKELRALALDEGADDQMLAGRDELETIVRCVAHLTTRVKSLQHRWIWRHALTGLPVRETLTRAIADDLAQQDRPTLLGAIRFADYNRLTVFDPAIADAALKRFSERLASSLGQARPMAQVDRDCFAIWFGKTETEAAAVELKALCYALGAEITAGDMTVVPEIEVGTAFYPGDAVDPAALINHALVCLAKPGADRDAAKSPGKAADVARERFALEQDLRHAIAREQLEMVFQPAVDLSRGLIGAEALLRWHHPQVGTVSPARFIPILEDADLIDEIGRWTLNAACREMRRWQQQGISGLRVAVNLSAAQLRDPTLKQTIQRTLARHRLSAQSLELELTETAATQDAERTFGLFRELRALGISLAIDDFGSGYSSLSYLKNLPFDKLKIDREFVVDVHQRKDSQAICRSLVELTRGLGLDILAEGVESWDEADALERLGCRTFQGFLFSQPLNSDQFIRFALDPQWRRPLTRPSASADGEPERRMSA